MIEREKIKQETIRQGTTQNITNIVKIKVSSIKSSYTTDTINV